ncbi:MAG: CBS domain-containing protein [Deltaproteobacteria bacterium]|nr:CBS domain-containing protein [Deltaproteobacteria bacterium]
MSQELKEGHLYRERREEVLERYRKAAVAREENLLRRQRKEVVAKCCRVAVIGLSPDPTSESFVRTEKLLGLGIEVVPVLPGCHTYLGMRCYRRLSDVPGQIDIVQVYLDDSLDIEALAREVVAKRAKAFWVEEGRVEDNVKKIFAESMTQVFEHESLEREYGKHVPASPTTQLANGPTSVRVRERMTVRPVTVKPLQSIHDAIEKMKKGGFRHLPVVDDRGRLIGMLSDRDIRLVRPSLAFVSHEDAALQLWSTAVRQAAVFDPVTIQPDAPLEQAAELMLRWEIGGLPVVDQKGSLAGIITYTDLLREFIARKL